MQACQEKNVQACVAGAKAMLKNYPNIGSGTMIDQLGDTVQHFPDPVVGDPGADLDDTHTAPAKTENNSEDDSDE